MKLFKLLIVVVALAVLFDGAAAAGRIASPGALPTLSAYKSKQKRSVSVPNLSSRETEGAIAKITPAVVSVYGIRELEEPPAEELSFLPLLQHSLMRYAEVNAGTGFFIDDDGYILTNKHVVEDDEAEYFVELQSGTRRAATVAYRDGSNDLAILKIHGDGFPTPSLGDSQKLSRGQVVLGIGNAFGQYKNFVTAGTVGALGQTIVAKGGDDEREQLDNLIESSTRLYPGHSGGPLFDLEGNVVGVNVAVSLGRDRYGYSIPINDAKGIISMFQE